MAENLNRHEFIGNLTKDPTGHDYGSGDNTGRRVEFRVAVNRRPPRGGGDSAADYFTVKVFGKLAENCEQYLAKGRKVYVAGRHQIDVVDKKDAPGEKMYFQSVIADTVEFLSPAPDGAGQNQSASGSASSSAAKSDVPF